jgi:UDP-N-acetylmuramoyl-L-alanyl-D-glutamate--2,6-diaminopimelate ligase
VEQCRLKIKKLVKDLDVKVVGSKEVEIASISSHSKLVAPGSLFIAKRGHSYDGNQYLFDAIKAGAVAVLTDIYNPFATDIVQIIVDDVSKMEAVFAARFYDDPAQELFLVGITGTNGKTTTSYLLKHLFELEGNVGVMGTIQTVIGEHQKANDLTTPDVVTCQKVLREMVVHGVKNAAMEVTSHALTQNRVDGIEFDVALFTNLTPDHLDYHGNMESYAEAKSKIFTKLKKEGYGLINLDDPYAAMISENCTQPKFTYSIHGDADFVAKEIELSLGKTVFTLSSRFGEGQIEVPLTGLFNVSNVLAASAVLLLKGMTVDTIAKRLSTFPQVSGRLEAVSMEGGRYVFVDFAHTEDSLRKVLSTLRGLSKGKIITVFGCGGNRDREKRPRMALAAEEFSDFVIVTTDNARQEDPEEIAREIELGFTKKNYTIELDRKLAIEKGIEMLSFGDTLLIAGKGHEKKQIFAHKTVPFDDVEVAKQLLNVLT